MNSQLDVFASSRSFGEEDVRDKHVVVIDVLRACSTIHTALENGANGVIPVAEKEDAGKYLEYLDPRGLLLCGEKDGIKIEGYHLGNSPLDYTPEKVGKKTLIMKTSNGTRAITRANSARKILIGSFLNIQAIVNVIRKWDPAEILLVCSGWKNRLSIEDMLCAGAISYLCYEKKLPRSATDGAKMAFGLYHKFRHTISPVIASSNHAGRLRNIGYEKDIAYCSQRDLFSSVPVMKDGMIGLIREASGDP